MKRIITFILSLLLPIICAGMANAKGVDYKTFVIGDETKPTVNKPEFSLLLSGGGDWPYEAFRIFAKKSGNGHLVYLRAPDESFDDKELQAAQNEFYNDIGGFSSVRTIAFYDRKAAYDPFILEKIKNADAIFLAGGDQSRYINYWKGTPLADALNAHIKANKPFGGTSAGLAVQGEFLYSCADSVSVVSEEALKNPLDKRSSIETDFIKTDIMKGVFTDSHFKERDRLGRLVSFVHKAQSMYKQKIYGLGIDEQTVLLVDGDGIGKVYSNTGGYAWLFDNIPINTTNPKAALKLQDVKATAVASYSTINLATKQVDNPAFIRNYNVENGKLVTKAKWSLAIHGGAGVLEPGDMSPEKEKLYRAGLDASLAAGQAVLEKGGSSLDAVEAAVRVMEDNPLFNAGKGAVFTAQGTNELDAAIMDGASLKAGAVAGVTRTKNPISLARKVMEKSGRLMLARDGADRFSIENGLEQVDPSYYYTDERWQQLQLWRAKKFSEIDQTHKFGTVGAVALDQNGNLAAATSTGGLTGKVFGRIGDTPIIGAGTIAVNGYAAVSCTGTGEYFIRESAGRQIVDRMRWNHQDIHSAAYDTIMSIGALGGDGGLIAMDKDGNAAFAINDVGMYRGFVSSDETKRLTSIYPVDVIKAEGKAAKTSNEMH